MPAQLTTKAQVNGYRFLLRRLDHALVRRDVRMLHDPMRSQ
ncbi:type VII secretion protein EccB, partial [Nocardia elegans]